MNSWKGPEGIPGKGIGKNTLKTLWKHHETPWKYPENTLKNPQIHDIQYFFPMPFVGMPFALFLKFEWRWSTAQALVNQFRSLFKQAGLCLKHLRNDGGQASDNFRLNGSLPQGPR